MMITSYKYRFVHIYIHRQISLNLFIFIVTYDNYNSNCINGRESSANDEIGPMNTKFLLINYELGKATHSDVTWVSSGLQFIHNEQRDNE